MEEGSSRDDKSHNYLFGIVFFGLNEVRMFREEGGETKTGY